MVKPTETKGELNSSPNITTVLESGKQIRCQECYQLLSEVKNSTDEAMRRIDCSDLDLAFFKIVEAIKGLHLVEVIFKKEIATR